MVIPDGYLPGVGFYVSESPGSPARLIAEGLAHKAQRGGPPAVIYAAENHNQAAEILQEHVLSLVAPQDRGDLRTDRLASWLTSGVCGTPGGSGARLREHARISVPVTPARPGRGRPAVADDVNQNIPPATSGVG